MVTTRRIGTAQGRDIHEITLRVASGAEARVLTWGATVSDLVIPTETGPQHVVVGFANLADYLADSAHAGATVGRFANRIAEGRFCLEGQNYQVTRNQDGRHMLHGGADGEGFSRRPWMLAAQKDNAVTMTLHSPDGEAGFPGAMDVRCTYRLLPPGTLRIEMQASCDAPTLCNLAHHSYFNLDIPAGYRPGPVPSALDHSFEVQADFYTPVDADLIPTGEVRQVAGTPFDFRKARKLRNADGVTFDLGFVLRQRAQVTNGLIHAATLKGAGTGMQMEVHTTEPHLQLYDGGAYDSVRQGRDGLEFGPHCGICLEPQRYPDSPNRSHFSDAVLRAGRVYQQVTEYRFNALSH
ncbi:aldose epimerase family protein [Roseinatronobacter alkalisoli]|uniref:Aldose 1-epimerase n=1 Tax=Roseinatronobacter alkalisoli TaxID=3028235 RepID=A0ABT5TI42_9RHOB|nr:aldose epimerase family protein [Roseinatronobacter sp. HJB301]MDD7973593.1 galactose mutarotase [Roseinatronobacter sp. HJB301]